MVIIQGKGTLSVTEPGRATGTYYEDAEITIYDMVVHFKAYNKYKTACLTNCLVGWDGAPTVREAGG